MWSKLDELRLDRVAPFPFALARFKDAVCCALCCRDGVGSNLPHEIGFTPRVVQVEEMRARDAAAVRTARVGPALVADEGQRADRRHEGDRIGKVVDASG